MDILRPQVLMSGIKYRLACKDCGAWSAGKVQNRTRPRALSRHTTACPAPPPHVYDGAIDGADPAEQWHVATQPHVPVGSRQRGGVKEGGDWQLGRQSKLEHRCYSKQCRHVIGSCPRVDQPIALVWTSLCKTWIEVLRPGSPGLGGTRGRLRHIAAVQQLEAHRLARLLSLPPRVGTLGHRGGWQVGARSVGG